MTPAERAAAVADLERTGHTGLEQYPGEGPDMAVQTAPGKHETTPDTRERQPWWVWAVGGGILLFMVGLGIYITTSINSSISPAPPETVEPTAATSPTVAPTTPAPTAEPTAATEEELAFEAAAQRYRDFVPVFAEAVETWDAPALSGTWMTPELAQFFVDDFARFADLKADGITTRWTQEIQSIEPVNWTPDEEFVIRVCAITNGRFIDANGNDITQTGPESDAPAAPINTTPRAKDIQLVWDGTEWRLAGFMQASNEGDPC